MPLQQAVDVSNYTGAITTEQARCLRASGVSHLIAGTQAPGVTRAQLQAALHAGMSTDAYVYLYWRRDVPTQVGNALAALEGLPIGRLWLDCEDDPAGLGPAQVEGLIASAVDAAGEFPVGIYTGRWWWQPNTGNSTAFSHLPLWHAEYTGRPEDLPDFYAFQPYGGWTRPAIWQYQGTTPLCGLNVDLNIIDAPPTPQATLAPPDALELALLRAQRGFLRALALGRYVFRPIGAGTIELQRVEEGHGVSFEPPYTLQVE
jgi:GH25 family lysozyme M1 (1,4-beta-N-acetylmuramidase)